MLHMTRTEVGEGEVTSVMVGATGRSTGENGKLKKKFQFLYRQDHELYNLYKSLYTS